MFQICIAKCSEKKEQKKLCAANQDLASRKIIFIFALRLFGLYGKWSVRGDRGQKCKEVLKSVENMHLEVDVREEIEPVQQSLKIAGIKKNQKTDGEDCVVVLTVVA